MDTQKGKIINDAFDIMKRTFKEINRLKDDVAELLSDFDTNINAINIVTFRH